MLTSRELLAAVRVRQGLTSNYALSRVLDVPEKSLQRWNTGKNTPDDAVAVRLAELAGLDPAEVLASMYAQRTTDPTLRALWERLAGRAQAAALAALAVILSLWIGGGPDGSAMASTPHASISAHRFITEATFYTLARFGRWIRRMFVPQTCRLAAA